MKLPAGIYCIRSARWASKHDAVAIALGVRRRGQEKWPNLAWASRCAGRHEGGMGSAAFVILFNGSPLGPAFLACILGIPWGFLISPLLSSVIAVSSAARAAD